MTRLLLSRQLIVKMKKDFYLCINLNLPAMKREVLFIVCIVCLVFLGCERQQIPPISVSDKLEIVTEMITQMEVDTFRAKLDASDIILTKDLLYDRYTLEDTYPYKDTVRSFKWETMRKCLAFIENMQRDTVRWGVFRNYKNRNGEAPLIRKYVRNVYNRVSDTLGVERYQSVPLYLPNDSTIPVRYGRDGSLAYLKAREGNFWRIVPVTMEGEWLIPVRYIRQLPEKVLFHHVIFVDRRDQNIATVERKQEGEWIIRSMNPATTGVHRPPYAQETPLGMFLLQEKKERMVFLKDGGSATGGYAPYASRFTNGAYIHGVPVNVPQTKMIEYSWSLGTIPRSHMCVRNATSHAKFVYDYMPTEATLVVIIE